MSDTYRALTYSEVAARCRVGVYVLSATTTAVVVRTSLGDTRFAFDPCNGYTTREFASRSMKRFAAELTAAARS